MIRSISAGPDHQNRPDPVSRTAAHEVGTRIGITIPSSQTYRLRSRQWRGAAVDRALRDRRVGIKRSLPLITEQLADLRTPTRRSGNAVISLLLVIGQSHGRSGACRMAHRTLSSS